MHALRMVWRIITFSAIPALAALASVTLLPLIAERYGPTGWSAVTVGTSVGAFFSVLGGLAWPVIGSFRVASAPEPADRARVYALSLVSRGLALGLLLVPACLVVPLLVHEHAAEAVLLCIGTGMNAMSAAWYWAGASNAIPLILTEGVLRLVAYAVAIVGMAAFGAGIYGYGFALIGYQLLSVLLNWLIIVPRRTAPRVTRNLLRDSIIEVRAQALGAFSRLGQAAFAYGGPTVFAIVNPAVLADFSAFDQIQKSCSNASDAVTNAFVGWVGSGGTETRRRAAIALLVCLLGAVAFTVLVGVFGGFVVDLVFAGRAHLTAGTIWLLGISASALFLIRAIELLALVPAGQAGKVYWGGLIGSLAGVAATAVGAAVLGVPGGGAGLLFASAVSGLFYLALSRSRRQPAVPPAVLAGRDEPGAAITEVAG